MLGEAKRPLIYAGGGVIHSGGAAALREFAIELRHSGRHDADGPRRVRHARIRCRCACSACTARRSRTTRSTIAISCSRSARASTIASPAIRRSSRRTRKRIAQIDIDASEINKVKPVQLASRRPAAGSAARAAGVRPAQRLQARLVRLARALRRTATRARDELRSRQHADPAVSRHRRDQQADARRGDHQHRRRPAPDVGRAVFRFPHAAPVADVRQHGHDGLRPAGRDRRAARESRQARHRHRRRREHPHESRRARNGHDLRPAGEDRRAEQLRRRHGQAVAEAVLQGPAVGQRQIAAQEGLRQGRAGGRLPLRRAARAQGRRARGSSRSSSSSRARRSSKS